MGGGLRLQRWASLRRSAGDRGEGDEGSLIIADIIRSSTMETIGLAAFPPDAIGYLHENLPETGVDALTEADDILGPGSMVICIGGTTSNIPPGVDVSDDKLPGASAAACPGASAACLVMMSC